MISLLSKYGQTQSILIDNFLNTGENVKGKFKVDAIIKNF